MPHSTAQYAFEHGLLGWAQRFRDEAGFLAVFSPAGELIAVHEADTASHGPALVSRELMERVVREHSSWMFFDPFDWPEYAWLAWSGLPRALLKRMLDELGPPGTRWPEEDLQKLPESWSVMF